MLFQGNHSALASSSSAAFAPTPFPPPAFHSPATNRHLHHHQFPTTPAPDDPTASFMAAASAVQSANAVVDAGAQRVQSMQLPSTLAPWQIQQISEEEFFATLPVFDMFPLSNGDENHVILYALLYAVLFLVGVCGNVSVITLIRHLHANTSYDNTMIYVLFLCCVDLASVVPLPMAIMDQLLGFWMFGTALCKVYRALEHVGRALSTFVLAAMAFDRFLRVCYPHKKTSRRVVLIQLLVLTMLTFVLLSPLLIKSSSREIVLKEVLLENPYRLARVRIFKCMDHLEGTLLSVFITYMFLIGFFLPVFLITIFYILMMRRLFKRSRTMSSSKLPVNRIAVYTIAISVFFVICWSPYWISMLYFNFMHWENEESERNSEDIFSSDKFIYIMYGIHALPYVNSASNWLLYGLLNSQLMRRAKYPNESTYYAGVGENGFGPYGGSIRLGTHPSTTPPQPSAIRFGSGSTTAAQQNGIGVVVPHNQQQQQQHSSLTVMSNGGGRCSSTLSAPVFGRGRKAAKANGQMIHASKCPLSPSPSARSISTVSAPPRTPMLGTTAAATINAPSAAGTMLMANSESDTELGGSIGGGSLNKPPLNGSLGGGHGVDKEARQRLLASDNDILL